MTIPNDQPAEPTESADFESRQPVDNVPAVSKTTPERMTRDSQTSKPAVGHKKPAKVQGSIAGGTWAALIAGALLLILLLVFILQNQDTVTLQLFAWEWNFPIGVGMLIAAIAGALIMALVGIVRMAQLRRQIKHSYR